MTTDGNLEGDDIPLREYTIGEDVPTIVPYCVEFGIGYRKLGCAERSCVVRLNASLLQTLFFF